ncbi:MAG TPA: type II CAAX endopeptidase family protein [bacterium]|nr:type II CAAX endopeptidase family protein [bacterium]HNS48175.1 type II CAAX endopeptidase family protein [bacterium]
MPSEEFDTALQQAFTRGEPGAILLGTLSLILLVGALYALAQNLQRLVNRVPAEPPAGAAATFWPGSLVLKVIFTALPAWLLLTAGLDALCFDGKLSFNHSAARAIIFSAALQLCLVGAILAGLRRRFLGTWQLGLDAWKTGYLRAGFWTYFSILPILAVIGLLQGLLQHGRLPDQEIYAVLMRIDSQGLLLLYLAVIALAAPFLEEIIFRGFLFGTLRSLFGYRRAALYSSLIFASLHQSVFAFLPIFCLALALCWLYEKSGSLWPSVVLHLLNNTVTAVFVLLLRQAIS